MIRNNKLFRVVILFLCFVFFMCSIMQVKCFAALNNAQKIQKYSEILKGFRDEGDKYLEDNCKNAETATEWLDVISSVRGTQSPPEGVDDDMIDELKSKLMDIKEGRNEKYKLYRQPQLDDANRTSVGTIDEIFDSADEYINNEDTLEIYTIDQDKIQDLSGTMYSILLTIAIVVAVVMGSILGLKMLTSSVEEKAEIKEFIMPYVVGCVIIFGAFGIWKLVVTILNSI